jgi:hypothetical protein
MKSILQIELTNHCNRRCAYCGQVNMTRKKGFMTDETLTSCISVLQTLKQASIGVHHYGESLLHPKFLPFLRRFVDGGITPWINTNGDFLSDEMIEGISQIKGCSVTISGHAEEHIRRELWQKCVNKGIKAWWQKDVGTNASNIAGQVPFDTAFDKSYPALKDPMNHCRFLKDQIGIVLFNGDLVPCCFDYDGVGVFGNINDENAASLNPRACKICLTCPGHPGNVV